MKTTLHITLALVALLFAARSAQAQIVWGASAPISGDSDVLTAGTPFDALQAGNGKTTTVVNGTTFNGGPTVGGHDNSDGAISIDGPVGTGTDGGTGTGSANYQYIMTLCAYVNADGALDGNGDIGTITIGSAANPLIIGELYSVELWNATGRDTIYSGTTPLDLTGGDFSIGTFNATSTTETLTFKAAPGSGYGVFSDIAVRDIDVPEPSTYALMLGGLALLAFCVRRKNAA